MEPRRPKIPRKEAQRRWDERYRPCTACNGTRCASCYNSGVRLCRTHPDYCRINAQIRRANANPAAEDARRAANAERMRAARRDAVTRERERAANAERKREARRNPVARARERAADAARKREARQDPVIHAREQAADSEGKRDVKQDLVPLSHKQAANTAAHRAARQDRGKLACQALQALTKRGSMMPQGRAPRPRSQTKPREWLMRPSCGQCALAAGERARPQHAAGSNLALPGTAPRE